MKYISLILILISAFAQASLKNKEGSIQDTRSMKSIGNFGVKIVLTRDDKEFRNIWKSTTDVLKVETIDSITQNSTIAAVLILHGCTPKKDGFCDIITRFFLVNPDGSKVPGGGGPVWNEKPIPDGAIQLGRASMSLSFSDADPLGMYKIFFPS